MNFQKDNNYKGNYYNSDICNYLGLDPFKRHYNSYIVKCLMNNLEFKYKKYQLNKDFIQIMNNSNNNNIYIGLGALSKGKLYAIVSQLQKPDIYIALHIYEEGNTIEQLVI